MADTVNKETRSKIMSRIRSKGNRSTEIAMRMLLVRAGISGWRLHPKGVTGNPDFIFPETHLAIFVDGCFWHGCPECGHIPKSNRKYWQTKILRNMERDKRVRSQLRDDGWTVLGIWEHELGNFGKVLSIIKAVLPEKSQS